MKNNLIVLKPAFFGLEIWSFEIAVQMFRSNYVNFYIPYYQFFD